MSEWQPIETAPKDTEVLVWDPSQGCVYIARQTPFYNTPFEGVRCLLGHHWETGEGGYGTPTHWMPLPEPPK